MPACIVDTPGQLAHSACSSARACACSSLGEAAARTASPRRSGAALQTAAQRLLVAAKLATSRASVSPRDAVNAKTCVNNSSKCPQQKSGWVPRTV